MVWIDNSQGIDWVANTDENTDENIPSAILIIGDRGSGKTTAAEGLKYYYYKQQYTILTITDAKDDLEAGFSLFEVEKDYHKRLLRRTGCPMTKIPTKIHHPLTLNLDKNKEYPDINWFSIDIKSLNRIDLGFLAETEKNTTSIQILLETIANLKDNQGLHHLTFYAENKTENMANLNKKGIRLRSNDPEDFYSKSKMGTEKTSGEIIKYFTPFLKDYSITPHNYERNLDITKIMNDQRHYQVFTYKYIKDKRLKSFYILHILQELIKHKDEMKYKIIIHIPELKYMLPQKSDGFTVFLAQSVSDMIATMRSSGFGVIGDTQIYSDTNNIVTGVMNEHYIGKMTSLKEYDYIGKALRLNKTEIDKMKSLRIGEWLCKITSKTSQESKLEKMHFYLPPHAHKEVFEKFEDKYKQKYPEQMTTIEPTIKELETLKKDIEEEVHKLVEEENTTKKTIIKQIKKEKQTNKKEEKKEVKTIQKQIRNESKDKAMWQDWKDAYENGIDGEKKSYQEIANIWTEKLGYKINKVYVLRKVQQISDDTNDTKIDEAIDKENDTPFIE